MYKKRKCQGCVKLTLRRENGTNYRPDGVRLSVFKMLIFFAFDNDDMESLKRRVTFLSLIFLLEL